jgi:hypothetical protein
MEYSKRTQEHRLKDRFAQFIHLILLPIQLVKPFTVTSLEVRGDCLSQISQFRVDSTPQKVT